MSTTVQESGILKISRTKLRREVAELQAKHLLLIGKEGGYMEEMLKKLLRELISQIIQAAIAPLVQEVRELNRRLDELEHPDLQKPITVTEAAKILGITRQGVQKAMRENRLKWRKVPGMRGRVTTREWIQEMLDVA